MQGYMKYAQTFNVSLAAVSDLTWQVEGSEF
jgi:hypothetical protein